MEYVNTNYINNITYDFNNITTWQLYSAKDVQDCDSSFTL